VSADEPLKTERDGGALIVTLQRPKARNALNKATLDQFDRIFAEIQKDHSIRVVLLRGAGGYFCAGGDLKERALLPLDGEGDTLLARNKREGALLRAIDALPQIVAAVVEGGAAGGGVGILCACDVAVAAGRCHFSTPEVLNGAVPAQIAPFLINRLGWSHGRRLLLTGARIDAAEALRLGLVHEWIADAEEADAAAERLLASLSRCDPVAVKGAKSLLARLRTDNADYYEEAARLYVETQKGRR
jgi:isohexenylglutaconyl-CoA hydratase